MIQNYLHQNKNREVKNREIRYLTDLSIVNHLSVFVLVQIILNYYPNEPTHRLYFGEVKTPHNYLPSLTLLAAENEIIKYTIYISTLQLMPYCTEIYMDKSIYFYFPNQIWNSK